VISGPTAIQFAYHPAGFRSTISWQPVPDAVAYQVYHADTGYYVGSVTGTSCVVYGMQGVLYHHYIVAVDSAGATSTPSNTVDILTSAPSLPAAPAGFDTVAHTAFGVETSTAPLGALPVKIPYEAALVAGDPTALKLMRYTGSGWVDVTTSVDTTRSFVLGASAPSAVFAVMQPNGSVEPTPTVVCTITVSAGINGTISPSAEKTVALGSDSATFSIVPDAGYHIADVLVDGVSVGPVTTYLFTDVLVGHTISATFAADEVTLPTKTHLSGHSKVKVRHALALTGRVTPAPVSVMVAVSVSRLVGKHWVGAGTARIAATNGAYRYDFRAKARGTYRIVAMYAGSRVGSTTYAPSASRPKVVRVR
jgi:hypothetical protein